MYGRGVPTRRISAWLIVGACAGAAPLPAGPGHGLVELHVRDAETGAPLTARVSLTRGEDSLIGEEQSGEHRVRTKIGPMEGSLEWRVRNQAFVAQAGHESAYVEADSVLRVPSGRSVLRVQRGPRAQPEEEELVVRTLDNGAIEIGLRYREGPEGWRCGDLHLHVARFDDSHDPDLFALLETEDLEFGGIVDWAGRADGRERGWGGWSWRARELRSITQSGITVFPLQAWGRPERTCELFVAGHETPISGRSRHSRAAIVETVTGEGGWAAGALGNVFVEAALLDRLAAVEILAMGEPKGLDAWYDVLNVGAHVAAIAGTDAQFEPEPSTIVDYYTPPGANRVCVRAETNDEVLAGIERGRTYVTTGPDLELEVEGAWIGATLDRAGPGSLRARVAMRDGVAPGGELELVRNGEVVWSQSATRAEIEARVPFEMPTSGWVALRLRGDERYAEFAHTSPVYVRVEGTQNASPESRARVAAAIATDEAIAESGASNDAEREVALRWAHAARRVLEARP